MSNKKFTIGYVSTLYLELGVWLSSIRYNQFK